MELLGELVKLQGTFLRHTPHTYGSRDVQRFEQATGLGRNGNKHVE